MFYYCIVDDIDVEIRNGIVVASLYSRSISCIIGFNTFATNGGYVLLGARSCLGSSKCSTEGNGGSLGRRRRTNVQVRCYGHGGSLGRRGCMNVQMRCYGHGGSLWRRGRMNVQMRCYGHCGVMLGTKLYAVGLKN